MSFWDLGTSVTGRFRIFLLFFSTNAPPLSFWLHPRRSTYHHHRPRLHRLLQSLNQRQKLPHPQPIQYPNHLPNSCLINNIIIRTLAKLNPSHLRSTTRFFKYANLQLRPINDSNCRSLQPKTRN